jgi:predicted nuclease of predicted toxin-antitoxin system
VKRLLLDQGLPRSTPGILIQAGWDVIHVADIRMSRADDIAILQRARAEQRVCITLDADFHAMLATSGEPGPSVIRVRKEGLDERESSESTGVGIGIAWRGRGVRRYAFHGKP